MSAWSRYADPCCSRCSGEGVIPPGDAGSECDCVAACDACGELIEWDHVGDAPTHHPDCSRDVRGVTD